MSLAKQLVVDFSALFCIGVYASFGGVYATLGCMALAAVWACWNYWMGYQLATTPTDTKEPHHGS